MLLGSFLNVVIFRLPQMTASGVVRRGRGWDFLALPLSYCPNCQTPIAPQYNIPLVSFLLLRGRSKCCRQPIGFCYPLVEIGGALIVMLAAVHFGRSVDFVLAVIFLSVLLTASVIDMRKYYLLDVLTLPLLWLGLLVNIDARFALLPEAVVGATGGYVAMFLLSAGGAMIFRRTAIAGGDIKLMAALGAWLGWRALPLLLFFACLIGVVYALLMYLVRVINSSPQRVRRRTFMRGRFCFGPALSLAGAFMLFYGEALIAAYWVFVGAEQ